MAKRGLTNNKHNQVQDSLIEWHCIELNGTVRDVHQVGNLRMHLDAEVKTHFEILGVLGKACLATVLLFSPSANMSRVSIQYKWLITNVLKRC